MVKSNSIKFFTVLMLLLMKAMCFAQEAEAPLTEEKVQKKKMTRREIRAMEEAARIEKDKFHEIDKGEHYLYEHDTLIATDKDHVYKIENLGDNVNTGHAESGPRISPDGQTLYFFRIDGQGNIRHTRDIWVSQYNPADSSWGEAYHAPKPINNHGDNSVHSVMKDGKALLLHNKYLKNGTTDNGLSVSFLGGNDAWSFPEELKIHHYSNDTVCSFHMDNDMNVLILAIKQKKDSYGKQDLYVSFRDKDSLHWTKPLNLGTTVNTVGAEATAFLDVDLKTLYFSSEGHENSLGGFDIYKTTRLDSTWTNWSKPVNIGAPFNTPDDEYYYSVPHVGDYVYLAHHFETNDSAAHSDIVRVMLKPNPIVTIVGKTYDGWSKKVVEAKVFFTKLDDETIIGEQISDTTEGYKVDLKARNMYTVTASAEGFVTKIDTVDLSEVYRSEERTMDIELDRNPALQLSGIIRDKKTNQPIGGNIVFKRVSDGEIVYQQKLAKGDEYNVLLPAGEKYEFTVIGDTVGLKTYMPKVDEMDLTALDKYNEQKADQLLSPLDVNIEIEDIFFETAKADLLPKSFISLDKLVKSLQTVPNLKIEIGGHTDSQGGDAYNQRLSESRAQSVVDYLISKGIVTKRLEYKGYGEKEPRATNKTAEGRQENRRVEFKAIK